MCYSLNVYKKSKRGTGRSDASGRFSGNIEDIRCIHTVFIVPPPPSVAPASGFKVHRGKETLPFTMLRLSTHGRHLLATITKGESSVM